MANQRKGTRDSGTAGGTDKEPPQGGNTPGQENERETAEKKDPPSPYHDVRVSEGGLTPPADPRSR